MKTTLIALLAIASLGLIIPSYAEVVPLPQLPTANWSGTDVQAFYPNNSTYIITISVHYTVENQYDVVESITHLDSPGQQTTIHVRDGYLEKFFPVEEIIEEVKPRVDHEKLATIIEDKKQEMIPSDESISNLRLCKEEFAEERPVEYDAWLRSSNVLEFTIPNQENNNNHLSPSELAGEKLYQACMAMKNYHGVGAYQANKIIDNSTSVPTATEYNDPRTDDATEEQIAAEAQRAEEYKCSVPGIQQGFCEGEFTGENRGDPDGFHTPFSLNEFDKERAIPSSKEKAIDLAQQTQCVAYYQPYEHVVAENVPQYLQHCIPEEPQ